MNETVFDRVGIRDVLSFAGHSIPADREMMRCPIPGHEDSTASFKIIGRGFHCFGCDTKGGVSDLIVALEFASTQSEAAQWLEAKLGITPWADVGVYPYQDASGVVAYESLRRERNNGGVREKKFLMRVPRVDGSFEYKMRGCARVLYRLPDVIAASASGETVIVVEGEKDADRLASIGFTVTTNAGGAGWEWNAAFAEPLRGAKRIVVLTDSDMPGRAAAAHRGLLLLAICNDVRVLDLAPDRADGFDVSDWLDMGHDARELQHLIDTTGAYVPELPSAAKFSSEISRGSVVTHLNTVDWNKVSIEAVDWALENRIPFAEFTIVEGDGGIGKTTMVLDIASRFSRGESMPDGTRHDAASVLVIAEEDRRSTVKARLLAGEGDLSRIHLVASVGVDEHYFTLPTDARALLETIRSIGAKLVVIDALFNHFDDDINANKAQDVRRALRPIVDIAHESGAAIIGIRHWVKTRGSAAERGIGSIDMRNIARSVVSVAPHPSDEGRFVAAVSKSNLGKPTDALTYKLVSTPVYGNGESVDVARVEWGDDVPISANELANVAPSSADDVAKVDVAGEFVVDFLADGPQPSAKAYEAGLESEIPRSTLLRAAKRVGVVMTRSGFPTRSTWTLTSHSLHAHSNFQNDESSGASESSGVVDTRSTHTHSLHSIHKKHIEESDVSNESSVVDSHTDGRTVAEFELEGAA